MLRQLTDEGALFLHFEIEATPLALYAIAYRLAQPERAWRPFQREGWRALAYRPRG